MIAIRVIYIYLVQLFQTINSTTMRDVYTTLNIALSVTDSICLAQYYM